MHKTTTISFILLLFFFSAQAQNKDLNFYYSEGMKAYEAKDYLAFKENFEQAYKIRNDHPTIIYNLAVAYSMNDASQKAMNLLNELITFRADTNILTDQDFNALKSLPEFKTIENKINTFNTVVSNAEEVFTVPGDLHPESVAYDASQKTFYIGSIRKKKIIKADEIGNISNFTSLASNNWSISGIKLDKKRNLLWACSVATPNMENFSKEEEGKSALLCFSLQTGELIKRYDINDSNAHWFGDLTISKKGNIFITDSSYPAIYLFDTEDDTLKLFKHFPELRSLQGITLSDDEKYLFFADYVKGIYRMNIDDTTQKILLKSSRDSSKNSFYYKGIDGLYFYQNLLIAIQNGVKPMRVSRFYLNKKMNGFEGKNLIENANPNFIEPTLGCIHKNTFYYVANSPWALYDKDFNLPNTANIPPVKIVKTVLYTK